MMKLVYLILILACSANAFTILNNIVRGRAVEHYGINLTLSELLNPIFYVKHPLFILVIALGFCAFAAYFKIYDLARQITGGAYTVILSVVLIGLVAAVFSLAQFYFYQVYSQEKVTLEMWKWIIANTALLSLSVYCTWNLAQLTLTGAK